MAKYKNKAGEYLYLFNWTSGGFNDVWAKNKKEAIKQIAKEFPGGKLQVNESTLRRCTYEEYQAQNRMGWMLSM